MKRLVFFLFLSLMMTSAKAVDYRSVGSNADFCVYTFDGEYYLVLSFEKVAINTIPEVYKRSKWTGKEKFGIGLYNDFKALKNEFDE